MTEKPLCNISVRGHMFCFFLSPQRLWLDGQQKEYEDSFRCLRVLLRTGMKKKKERERQHLYKPLVLIWRSSQQNAKTRSLLQSWLLLNTRVDLWSHSPGEGTAQTSQCSQISFLWTHTHTLTSLTLNILCNVLRIMIISYLIHVITLFSGHHMDASQWKYVMQKHA